MNKDPRKTDSPYHMEHSHSRSKFSAVFILLWIGTDVHFCVISLQNPVDLSVPEHATALQCVLMAFAFVTGSFLLFVAGPVAMARDPLAEAGFYFDELNKLRVLEPDVSQKTSELKEECKEFVDSKHRRVWRLW